jgi:hypothetical protein
MFLVKELGYYRRINIILKIGAAYEFLGNSAVSMRRVVIAGAATLSVQPGDTSVYSILKIICLAYLILYYVKSICSQNVIDSHTN